MASQEPWDLVATRKNAPCTSTASDITATSTGQLSPSKVLSKLLPKVDKPRPHVCSTCKRAFARLEHLKRHERSHTKEKPFGCPVCQRRFARRDLLLRHQQKLHQTGQPARPRMIRRESTTALKLPLSPKGRKNSMPSLVSISTTSCPLMRPRANTISHINISAHGHFSSHEQSNLSNFGHHSGSSTGTVSEYSDLHLPGYSLCASLHGISSVSKRETSELGIEARGEFLRTALDTEAFELEKLFGPPTVNPAQLHYDCASDIAPSSPFATSFPQVTTPGPKLEGQFDWHQLDNAFASDTNHDFVMDQASPFTFSAGSASAIGDMTGDVASHCPNSYAIAWSSPNTILSPTQFIDDSIPTTMFAEFV